MIRNLSFLFLASLVLILFSCKKDDPMADDEMMPEASTCNKLSIEFQKSFEIDLSEGVTSSLGAQVMELSDGQFLMAAPFTKNLYLFSSEGETVWSYQFEVETGVETVISGLAEKSNGHILLAGFYHAGFSNEHTFIAEIDLNQNTIWKRKLEDYNDAEHQRLIKTQDGNFVLSFDAYYVSTYQTFIQKIDPEGNQIWEVVIDSGIGQSQVVETANGNFLGIAGRNTLTMSSQLNLFSITKDGGLQGQNLHGNASHENPRGLVSVSENEVIVAGFVNEVELLTKLSLNSEPLWRINDDNPDTARDRIYDIEKTMEADEFIYLAFNENDPFNGVTKIARVDTDGLTTPYDLQLENIRATDIRPIENGYIVGGYTKIAGLSKLSMLKLTCE